MNIPQGTQREMPEEGAHNGVCIQVIDLGTQQSSNPEFGAKRKILIGFELPDIENEDGGATIISQQFTFTDSERGNLVKTLRPWLGLKTFNGFDMDECLGKAANISVVHNQGSNGKEYANIANISGLPKGTKVRKPQSALVSLYLDDSFDAEVFEALPEWIRTKIASSPEYEACAPQKPAKGQQQKAGKAAPAKTGGNKQGFKGR